MGIAIWPDSGHRFRGYCQSKAGHQSGRHMACLTEHLALLTLLRGRIRLTINDSDIIIGPHRIRHMVGG